MPVGYDELCKVLDACEQTLIESGFDPSAWIENSGLDDQGFRDFVEAMTVAAMASMVRGVSPEAIYSGAFMLGWEAAVRYATIA